MSFFPPCSLSVSVGACLLSADFSSLACAAVSLCRINTLVSLAATLVHSCQHPLSLFLSLMLYIWLLHISTYHLPFCAALVWWSSVSHSAPSLWSYTETLHSVSELEMLSRDTWLGITIAVKDSSSLTSCTTALITCSISCTLYSSKVIEHFSHLKM